MLTEKRRFSRIPFQVKAEVTINDLLYSSDKIDNLSIGGCLLPIDVDVATGTECRLKILLNSTSSELSVQIGGEIFRSESGGVAVRFTEIEPDSLFHLQNIILYNHPDTAKIEQEIKNHPGLE